MRGGSLFIRLRVLVMWYVRYVVWLAGIASYLGSPLLQVTWFSE